MINVIGFKGTSQERQENWSTILRLRRDIKCLKGISPTRFKSLIEKETQWEKNYFRNYVKPANDNAVDSSAAA